MLDHRRDGLPQGRPVLRRSAMPVLRLGKTANGQLAVSLHRADEAAGTSQPLSWQLFLPESWIDGPARCQRVGVPPEVGHQSKQDLALGLLDQALGWRSPAGVVLADEAYGGSFEWRLAPAGTKALRLRARALVGGARLETGTAARAGRRDRAHRVACRRTCSRALLAGATAQTESRPRLGRGHGQGALTRGAGPPRVEG